MQGSSYIRVEAIVFRIHAYVLLPKAHGFGTQPVRHGTTYGGRGRRREVQMTLDPRCQNPSAYGTHAGEPLRLIAPVSIFHHCPTTRHMSSLEMQKIVNHFSRTQRENFSETNHSIPSAHRFS
jgi:hypothetical protein